MTEVCSLCHQAAAVMRLHAIRQIDCRACGSYQITDTAHERLMSAPDNWRQAFRTQLSRMPAHYTYVIEIPRRLDGGDFDVPVGRVVPTEE